MNTSRQIGGAIGIAAVSAVAATSSRHFGVAGSAASLDHGFQTGLYVLTALLVVGAAVSALVVRPAPAHAEEAEQFEPVSLGEAA